MSRSDSAPVAVFEDNPSAQLVAVFERIYQENMKDLPIVNDRLRVEAVGFERWRGQWLGIVITPWFLNILLVPGDISSWPQISEGERLRFQFESGTYIFSALDLDGFGQVMACSLASPVKEYPSQEIVRDTAEEVMGLIHQASEQERGADLTPAGVLQQGAEEGGCGMSRRAFLRGNAPVEEGQG